MNHSMGEVLFRASLFFLVCHNKKIKMTPRSAFSRVKIYADNEGLR